MKLQLKNITLIIIDCLNLERAQVALDICQKNVDFGEVKLLTNLEDENDKRIIKIDKIDSIKKYSTFCIKKLNDYVNTEYCLLIQYDGFILNANSWDNEFLKFDYLGPKDIKRSKEENRIVINGGFTLRSKRLLSELQKINDEELEKELIYGEDYIIFRLQNELREKGLVFPESEILDRFAIDTSLNKIDSKNINSFGFHGLLINLDYFLKSNPEFQGIKKYFQKNTFILKHIYNKTFLFFNKIPILNKLIYKVLTFFKKVYYRFFY